MIYKRHYIQYNDLVFDDYDLISEDDATTSFKVSSTDYSYAHGAYLPFKSEYGLVNASRASLTIVLRMKSLPCEYRPFYRRFAVSQLARHGRLWAVQDNTLVWAYATPNNISESQASRKDTVELDVDFVIPEGVWHKADKQRTFLVPWDKCDFMECYDFKEVEPCFSGDCCHCDDTETAEDCLCCECDISKDMALCYHTDEIQKFYDCRGAGYKVIYDCTLAEKYFGDFYGKEHLGQKFCSKNGIIAGLLYSDTDIDTTGVKITLHGPVKDPYVEINGNGNIISGEYTGVLTINPDGSVTVGNDCTTCDPLSVSNWVIPEEMNYGWVIHPGNNRIVIETGECCEMTCAYIEVDSLTI